MDDLLKVANQAVEQEKAESSPETEPEEETQDEGADEEVEATDESPTSDEEDDLDDDDDEDDGRNLNKNPRFRQVYRQKKEAEEKLRYAEEKAALVDEISRATGMSPEQIKSKLGGLQGQQQNNQQGYQAPVDNETRRIALQASRDSQIARLLREEPDAVEFIDNLEDAFIENQGKKSIQDLYEPLKRAMKVGRSGSKKSRSRKRAAKVESGQRTRSAEDETSMTKEKFERMNHEDKTKWLKSRGLIPK